MRLTNAEAIKMGLMAAPPAESTEVPARRGSGTFILVILGWFLGFVMGLMF